jgi:uncharacterized protein YodC (DUF2158 family)
VASGAPEVGSVVRLKTGGPSMTVERVHPDGGVITCVWFDEIISEKAAGWGKFNREKFDADALEVVEEQAPIRESNHRVTGHHAGCPALGIRGSQCTCPPDGVH